MPFYSLYIPSPGTDNSSKIFKVFRDKKAALDLLKQHRDARLREFQNEVDAFNYTQTGSEIAPTAKHPDTKPSSVALERVVFRAPIKQELAAFRRNIEAGDYETVRNKIIENPRYLVSSGDTPSCLREGARYNAIHVCALSKQDRIAELVLQTVSDPKFAEQLTGVKGDMKMCKEMSANLLDYYLNCPEKVRGETPLHLATKFGAIKVVQVLTSYPQCNINVKNIDGQLPSEIIGDRCASGLAGLEPIRTLLSYDQFYVPVLRSVSNDVPPEIGQPFALNNPPNLNTDPLSPEIKIQAVAGPMKLEDAKQFRRRWKTPPRVISNNTPNSSGGGASIFGAVLNLSSPQFSGSMKTTGGLNIGNNTPMKAINMDIDNFTTPKPGQCVPRVLFQSTPVNDADRENIVASHILDVDNGDNNDDIDYVATETVNGQCMLLIDKQNGNHEMAVTDMIVAATTTTTTTTTIQHNNNAANNEPNNNININMNINININQGSNHNSLDGGISTTPPPKKNMLRNALCPGTALLQMKRDLFNTYRDTNVLSPVIIDAGFSSNGDSIIGGSSMCHRDDDEDDMTHERSRTPVYSRRTPSFLERHLKIADAEKGLEVIGREMAREKMVEWREYWDFLDEFICIYSHEGLDRLNAFFGQRQAEEDKKRCNENAQKIAAKSNEKSERLLTHVCNAIEEFSFTQDDTGTSVITTNKMNQAKRWLGCLTKNAATLNDAGSSIENNTSNDSSHNSNTFAQLETPHTCVEKSIQVFAKRMTKTIMHNMNNLVSINDTLLSELKRLKSLICSFKEDTRFQLVNFGKVHSRIGNLISIYLENSTEMNASVKKKIQKNLQNLMVAPGERREHFDCVCTRIDQMLRNPLVQIQPENLKTEGMCVRVWENENVCNCPWETNLGRKSSRHRRKNNLMKVFDNNDDISTKPVSDVSGVTGITEADVGGGDAGGTTTTTTATKCLGNWRNSSGSDSNADSEDDMFWSDFGGGSTDDEADDVWLTPPESPTVLAQSLITEEGHEYTAFIFGSEPTKRDLDVLNAIFHLKISPIDHPYLFAWRFALLRYTCEQMDLFPSIVVNGSTKQITGPTIKSTTPCRSNSMQKSSVSASSQFMELDNSLTHSSLNQVNNYDNSITATMNVSDTNMSNNKTCSFNDTSSKDQRLQTSVAPVVTLSDWQYSTHLQRFVTLIHGDQTSTNSTLNRSYFSLERNQQEISHSSSVDFSNQ